MVSPEGPIELTTSGSTAGAVALFQQLNVTYPDSGECRHYLWTAARQNQKTASRSLIIIMSNFIKILIYNLKLFYQLLTNNISSAIQTQEQIIMLNPDNTAAFHKLATFFMHQNQTELRKTALEEILLFNKQNTKTLFQLTHLYFKEKDFQKATISARKLLNLNPNQLEAENILKDIAALDVIKEGFQ